MNEEEYYQWVKDARHCLAVKYNSDEIEVIMDWFGMLKGNLVCILG